VPITFGVQTANTTTAADGRSSNGDFTINLPANWVAGQLAILLIYNDQGTCAEKTTTAWTQITGSPFGSNPTLQIFRRFLQVGDTTWTFTVSNSGTNLSTCAGIMTFGGVHATTPIEVIGSASTGTGSPMTAGSINTLTNGAWAVGLCGRGDNETTDNQSFGASTTGVTERLDAGTNAGNDSQVSAYSKEIALAGATGDGSADTSATDPWLSVIIALKPVADVTVALTGQSGTSALGALAIAATITLGGVLGTGAVQSVTPDVEVALTGVQSAGAVGNIIPRIHGVQATGAVGNVTPEVTFPDTEVELSGVESTGGVGSVAAQIASVLSGVQGSGAAGSVTSSHALGLPGVQGTGSVESLSPEFTVPQTGVTASSLAGSPSAGFDIGITGQQATASAGDTAPDPNLTIPLSGVGVSGAVDSYGVFLGKGLSGEEGTGGIDDVAVELSLPLLGQGVSGSAGSVGVSGAPVEIGLAGVGGDGFAGSVGASSITSDTIGGMSFFVTEGPEFPRPPVVVGLRGSEAELVLGNLGIGVGGSVGGVQVQGDIGSIGVLKEYNPETNEEVLDLIEILSQL
jgi:hypothetical protein